MKALMCHAYGPIDSLKVEDVPSPQPGPDQVLITVKAAALNFPDALVVQGLYQHKPTFPFSPGGEVAGVIKARETGQGQVVDCAMSDGAASLMAMFYGFKAAGGWKEERRSNLLDGGAHFYDTYQCSDGKWVSIGSIEPQFYALLLEKTGINDPEFQRQMDRGAWDGLREKLAHVIAQKTQAEWDEIMGGTDVCFGPVLDLDEAPKHPHNVARETFVEVAGVIQPAPAPRFSATPGKIQGPPPSIGAHDQEALSEWGFSAGDIGALKAAGALA